MRETHEIIHPEPGVDIELRTYGLDDNRPPLVLAKGLGGCATTDALVEGLARRFRVTVFSPRNAGGSTGLMTLDNFVSDLGFAVLHVEQHTGRKPFGMGHSFGGHAFARLLGEKPVVEKAVLATPLIHILEQNPPWFTAHLRSHVAADRVPWSIKTIARIYNTFLAPAGVKHRALCIDQQRFPDEGIVPFLRSLLEADACSARLRSPAYVMLTGKANFGQRLRGLDELAAKWRALGAHEVDVFGELDHFFSNGGAFFRSARTDELLGRIARFLLGESAKVAA